LRERGPAYAGGEGVYIPELGITVPAEKAAPVRHSLARGGLESTQPSGAAATPWQPDIIPAKLLGPEVPVPISPEILKTSSGWLVSDGKTLVAVYAGSAGNDLTKGRAVIVRQDRRAGVQTVNTVDSAKSGALRIVVAPLGPAVVKSAQSDLIVLHGTDGVVRTLDLATDTLSTK
jgi:hypothetical protein